MLQFKLEVCQLIAAITGSPRVGWARLDKKSKTLTSLACTLGNVGLYDVKYDLPLLGSGRKCLFVSNVKKVPELSRYPGNDIVHNFRSVAAYLIRDDSDVKSFVVAWNPPEAFFRSENASVTVDRIISACCKLEDEVAAQVEISVKQMETTLQHGNLQEASVPFHAEPLSKFLMDTLIKRQRLLARNGVPYVAVRQWRKTIKAYQIKALEALKSEEIPTVADAIGAEIADAVKAMYGKLFDAVIPIPGGSSHRERSLSVLIAEAAARRLEIPCQAMLIGGPVAPGASHPKKSAKLEDYTVKPGVKGKVLIIDDVATSGRHIELAMKALKPHTDYCTAVTWIAD